MYILVSSSKLYFDDFSLGLPWVARKKQAKALDGFRDEYFEEMKYSSILKEYFEV
jgi:hypothetical protein